MFASDVLELVKERPLPGTVLLLVFVIGSFHILSKVLSFVHVLWDVSAPNNAIRRYQAPRTSSARTWAIVTGPTAGIGQEFALQLAKLGFNVALVGRNKSKLDAVAEEIKGYHVETAHFILDAAAAYGSEYAKLGAWAAKLGSVTVLVNNVGVSHEMPVPFEETTHDEMHGIVGVNVMSTLDVTKAVLPVIKDSVSTGAAKRGLILTMGSFAGLTPTPLLATYSGSKAFLQGWNSALAAELAPEGIDAQLVLSYLVTSAMSKVRRTSMLIPSPKSFVKAAINGIGRRGGAQERAYTSTPYWSHALMHWAIAVGPGVWSEVVAKLNRSMHVDIRRRALRKLKKDE